MGLQTLKKTLPDVSHSLDVSTSGCVHCADGGWERSPSDVSQHVTNNHAELARLNPCGFHKLAMLRCWGRRLVVRVK